MTGTIADTIPRQFLASVEAFDKPNAFRRKRDGRYVDVSHREVFERVHALTCALRSLGLAKGDRVALLSENRLEWVIADLGILSAGCVNVPVYATLPPHQIEYVIRDAEARAVFVSTRAQLEKIHEIRGRLLGLEHVIAFDADAAGKDVLAFDALVARDRTMAAAADYRALIASVAPADWASIIYTSGTTGEPKGAVLTHGNFMSNVHQCLAMFDVGPSDTCLSFLPLSHVFERTAGFYVMMTAGVTIAYAESMETVAQNMIEVSPTVVCSVPRLYEKMYARILDNVDKGSAIKRALFRRAVRSGRTFVAESLAGGARPLTTMRKRLADALVFRKLKARTGGRLRFFVSGGAPLAREIAEFFYAAGLPILEGYGLTETSPVLAVNTFEHFRFGSVGKPVPGVEIRIAEDGEILARGENVMQGYFKKPEQTASALEGGWFHTGDIGYIDQDGFLVITDRKKDLIATAGGKKIAPQPIENRLKQNPYVAEAILIGDRRPFISLLIVPNFEKLADLAAENGLPIEDRTRLVESQPVRDAFQRAIDEVNIDLAQFERIKNFVVLERELSVAEGHLTPTLKVRRRIIEELYKDRIDALYRTAP